MTRRLVQLAALAVVGRELARLVQFLDPDLPTPAERLTRLERIIADVDREALAMNIPRRLSAVEQQAESTAASHAALARSVATLEDRVDEATRRSAPDAEDVTT